MSFGDYDVSISFRETIEKLVTSVVDKIRPTPRYGIVTAIDAANFKCSVTLNGDPSPVVVNTGSNIPDRVGQTVRVAGTGADRYIDDIIAPAPSTVPGQITMFGGTTAPAGWLLCQGQSLVRATYPKLFTAIGTAYGSTSGTTFNLPDLRSRVPVGLSSDTNFNAMGKVGGATEVQLTISQIPSHSHRDTNDVHILSTPASNAATDYAYATGTYNSSLFAIRRGRAFTDTDVGGNGFHPNLQPYITMNYIIAI